MSEEAHYVDVKTVSRDGVTVERELLCTDAGIRGSFEIDSRRDGPVEVRIVDELPQYFPIDDVAFRPVETPEYGDISEREVSVTQRVGGRTVRVEYGIVPSEPVAEIRWSAPTIQRVESVDPAEAGAETDSPAGADTDGPAGADTDGPVGPVSSLAGLFGEDADPSVRAVDATSVEETESPGDRASESALEPGPNDRDLQADGRGADRPTAAEPADRDSPGPDAASPDADGTSAGPADAADGQLDAVDEEAPAEPAGDSTTERRVSDPPDGDTDVARSFEVRLDRLTTRVEKFGAYASALEGLIDEHGTGTAVVEDIERDLDDLEQRLDAVRSDVESVRDDREEALADVHDSVDRIDAALDEIEAEVGTIEAAVDGLEGGLDDAEQGLDALEDRVDEHDATIEDVETGLTEVESDVDDVEHDVAAVESEVTDVQGDVTAVEADVTEVRDDVADVQGDVEAVESDVTTVEREVEAVENGVEAVHGEVAGVESDLRALEDRVDGFESELGSLRESVEGIEDELSTVSETAQSVSAELDAIHDEVETLHEFRRSLAQISDVDG
jgi:predicted  nucleic acid-binding Zn-ribbon protein